jgi:hypothetical protein
MRHFAIASALALVSACAADDSASPTISDLTASPSSMKVGQQVTVSGTLVFEDADGNLDQLGAEITMPDGTVRPLAMTDLLGVGDMTNGTLGWQMFVVPPTAGTYKLSLWLTDHDGNESNRLETTATATP